MENNLNNEKTEKLKVFVSAYACEPGLGSEIGIGWHWTQEMSKYFELWILTRKSNQTTIEMWMEKHGNPNNIHYVYYDLPKAISFWKKGLRGVRLYYNLWQMRTNRIVKKTMRENDIKIYHLLTYGNSMWPASRYGMKQTFIWGPTGGADYIKGDFTKFYGPKSRVIEIVRRWIVKMLPITPSFRKRCKRANLILCKSTSMYNLVPEKYKSKAKIFTDGAVDEEILQKDVSPANSPLKYLTVGRMNVWRNFDVLVEAFTKAHNTNPNIELDILGDGKDYDRIKRLIGIREKENVIHLHGYVSMEEYIEYMKNADVVINSSYKEGSVTMSFDAMGLDKPLICIDTGGYTRYFKEGSSIVIPRGTRDELIKGLKDAILKIYEDDYRSSLREKTYEVAQKNTWSQKGKEIASEIVTVYKNCEDKQ